MITVEAHSVEATTTTEEELMKAKVEATEVKMTTPSRGGSRQKAATRGLIKTTAGENQMSNSLKY